jgi:hypothetical protein
VKRTAIYLFLIAIVGPWYVAIGQADGVSLYPHPPAPAIRPADRDLSCAQLDREIAELEPLTYSYKPGFYQDPAHGAAIWGGALAPPVAGYLIYSGVAEYYDEERMLDARNRIEVLRRLKAYRRCYE